jgi:hypothetical protein
MGMIRLRNLTPRRNIMKNMIPILLLILLVAAPAHAEDVFEIKINTHFEEIKKDYPDIRLFAETLTSIMSEEERAKFGKENPNSYEITCKKSIFKNILLNFDKHKLLESYSASFNHYFAIDKSEGDKAFLYYNDHRHLRSSFDRNWILFKLHLLKNLGEPESVSKRVNAFNAPIVTTRYYTKDGVTYRVNCDQRHIGFFSIEVKRKDGAKTIY